MAIGVTPAANRIEVLQSEAQGIDLLVALVAGWRIAVLLQLVTDRLSTTDIGVERLDVGWGR